MRICGIIVPIFPCFWNFPLRKVGKTVKATEQCKRTMWWGMFIPRRVALGSTPAAILILGAAYPWNSVSWEGSIVLVLFLLRQSLTILQGIMQLFGFLLTWCSQWCIKSFLVTMRYSPWWQDDPRWEHSFQPAVADRHKWSGGMQIIQAPTQVACPMGLILLGQFEHSLS